MEQYNYNIGNFLDLNGKETLNYSEYATISYLSNENIQKNHDVKLIIKKIGKEIVKQSINTIWINTIDGINFKGYDESRNILDHLKIYSNSKINILAPTLYYPYTDIKLLLIEMLERLWCKAEIIVSKYIYIWDGEKIKPWYTYTELNDTLSRLQKIKYSPNLKMDLIENIENSKSKINFKDDIISSILQIFNDKKKYKNTLNKFTINNIHKIIVFINIWSYFKLVLLL